MSLLISLQESEKTRLQARISSLERAADRQNLPLYDHPPPLPALQKFPQSTDHCSSTHSPPASPKKLPTAVRSAQTCPSPKAHADLQPTSVSHLFGQTENHQSCDWLQSSSINSSLDLPQSLKDTLREALSQQPWESSDPDTVDRSWQGLSSTESTVSCDPSFDPLTYMVDTQEDTKPNMDLTLMQEGGDEQTSEMRRESVCTLVDQEEEEEDMSSLTGMLRFVTQTLAKQEDLS